MDIKHQDAQVESFGASTEMQQIFSDENRFRAWRHMWIALAKAEQAAGLPVTSMQIAELEAQKNNINYDAVHQYEEKLGHDVASHVLAFGAQCPGARSVLHRNAASCFVEGNAEILAMKQGMELLRSKLLAVISFLADFALKHKDLPTLGYPSLQPTQVTSVGMRASTWLQYFWMDFEEMEMRITDLGFLGCRGTPTIHASFARIFLDKEKTTRAEHFISTQMGMDKLSAFIGQVYCNKAEHQVLFALSGIAESASKFAGDIRLLQSFREMEEPLEKEPGGFFPLPYRRNPSRCEQINSLSRRVILAQTEPSLSLSNMWMETAPESPPSSRLGMSEGFFVADAILNLLLEVCGGLTVYPNVCSARLNLELPNIAAESILALSVKKGANKQALHRKLHTLLWGAAQRYREEGQPVDLLALIAMDSQFGLTAEELAELVNPVLHMGDTPRQVEEFLYQSIFPLLGEYAKFKYVGKEPEEMDS